MVNCIGGENMETPQSIIEWWASQPIPEDD